MRYWFLMVENNECFIVDKETLDIIQCNRFMKGVGFTDNWRLVGFVEVKPFGRLSGLITPAEFIQRGLDKNMLFKNGKSRYRVVDYDHGTKRIWGMGPKKFFETSGR